MCCFNIYWLLMQQIKSQHVSKYYINLLWIKFFRINFGKADEDQIENTKMFFEEIIIIFCQLSNEGTANLSK